MRLCPACKCCDLVAVIECPGEHPHGRPGTVCATGRALDVPTGDESLEIPTRSGGREFDISRCFRERAGTPCNNRLEQVEDTGDRARNRWTLVLRNVIE